jgi:hypothetical protein
MTFRDIKREIDAREAEANRRAINDAQRLKAKAEEAEKRRLFWTDKRNRQWDALNRMLSENGLGDPQFLYQPVPGMMISEMHSFYDQFKEVGGFKSDLKHPTNNYADHSYFLTNETGIVPYTIDYNGKRHTIIVRDDSSDNALSDAVFGIIERNAKHREFSIKLKGTYGDYYRDNSGRFDPITALPFIFWGAILVLIVAIIS